jgi:hypothetical protein
MHTVYTIFPNLAKPEAIEGMDRKVCPVQIDAADAACGQVCQALGLNAVVVCVAARMMICAAISGEM